MDPRPSIAALLLTLAILPHATAQQSSALVVSIAPPPDPVADRPVAAEGYAMLTADWTALTSLNGIPVTYSVSRAPEWATVLISPTNDVFPIPATPTPSASFTSVRSFQVTVILAHPVTETLTDLIEITATTQAGLLGRPTESKGAFTITAVGQHACPETTTPAEGTGNAPAPTTLAEAHAQPDGNADVTVQQAAAMPIPTPWIAVAAFGLVGAGVGVVLRDRMRRA